MRDVLPKFRAKQTPYGNVDPAIQEFSRSPGDDNGGHERKSSALAEFEESRQDIHAEGRPFFHKYFFRRPRLLQYYDNGELVDSYGQRASVDIHEHLVDDTSGDPKIQRGMSRGYPRDHILMTGQAS